MDSEILILYEDGRYRFFSSLDDARREVVLGDTTVFADIAEIGTFSSFSAADLLRENVVVIYGA